MTKPTKTLRLPTSVKRKFDVSKHALDRFEERILPTLPPENRPRLSNSFILEDLANSARDRRKTKSLRKRKDHTADYVMCSPATGAVYGCRILGPSHYRVLTVYTKEMLV